MLNFQVFLFYSNVFSIYCIFHIVRIVLLFARGTRAKSGYVLPLTQMAQMRKSHEEEEITVSFS